jgi:hypothetical protein
VRCMVDGADRLVVRSSANDLMEVEPLLVEVAMGQALPAHVQQRGDSEMVLSTHGLATGVHVLRLAGGVREQVCRFVLAR